MPTINVHVFRLTPGDDLKNAIQYFVEQNKLKAAWMVTCVGSLTNYAIRFANQPASTIGSGHFEVVSLVGTVSENGSHLHISISDSKGNVIGGHLQEGCIIYTTAEIVIQSATDMTFSRLNDGTINWKELQVTKNKGD